MPSTRAEKGVILALRKFIHDILAGNDEDPQTSSEHKKSARSKTPYMLFCAAKRGEITEALTKLEGQNPRSAIVTKKLGEIWSKMSVEERQPFVDESERLKREPAETDQQAAVESEAK